LNQGKLFLSDSLFVEKALIFKHLNAETIVFGNVNSGPFLSINIPRAPYLALWSWPFENRHFICIEPWWGLPDMVETSEKFINKKGIEILDVGQRKSGNYSISILN